jgi:hypothetical protein
MEIQEEPLEVEDVKETPKRTDQDLKKDASKSSFGITKRTHRSKNLNNFPVNPLARSSNESLLGRKSIAEVKEKIWLDTINAGRSREQLLRPAENLPRHSYSRGSGRPKSKSKAETR